jgi:hypothetical protein
MMKTLEARSKICSKTRALRSYVRPNSSKLSLTKTARERTIREDLSLTLAKRVKLTPVHSKPLALRRLSLRDLTFLTMRKKKKLKTLKWKLQTMQIAKWTQVTKVTWMVATVTTTRKKEKVTKENNKKRRRSAREMKWKWNAVFSLPADTKTLTLMFSRVSTVTVSFITAV